jgi:hypothetical protein
MFYYNSIFLCNPSYIPHPYSSPWPSSSHWPSSSPWPSCSPYLSASPPTFSSSYLPPFHLLLRGPSRIFPTDHTFFYQSNQTFFPRSIFTSFFIADIDFLLRTINFGVQISLYYCTCTRIFRKAFFALNNLYTMFHDGGIMYRNLRKIPSVYMYRKYSNCILIWPAAAT